MKYIRIALLIGTTIIFKGNSCCCWKKNNEEDTLLKAVSSGKKEKVESLVQRKANVNNVLLQDGYSVLMYSVTKAENTPITKILIDAQADVNAQDHYGNSALMLAISLGNRPAVQTLLAARANVQAVHKSTKLTPLMFALKTKNNAGIIQDLREATARERT